MYSMKTFYGPLAVIVQHAHQQQQMFILFIFCVKFEKSQTVCKHFAGDEVDDKLLCDFFQDRTVHRGAPIGKKF
ncbi:hypothetical protein B9Z55_013954 [Caenorhabditis nigoni]|uniref:Uncharacterized protein n=1 Tax=Caenorhabditis nigoni TaxID=1611254 RepID=A0A2G5U3Z0_9PELO|nr:hypothetical protein B9Z55_013954 [Caenorhabditis nigoni]